MRVLHVIPSLSPKDGGPSFAVKTMAEALAGEGVQVTIATTGQEETTRQQDYETAGSRESESVAAAVSASKHAARVPPQGSSKQGAGRAEHGEGAAASDRGYNIIWFRREFESYKVSFGLTKWLRTNVTKFDLVHVHALFSFSSTMAARIARQNAIPYVVRPLGVLNRWGMQNRRRLPKLVSFRVVELPILLHAAAIHYTSEAERDEAALLDPRIAKHESVVIPLPVALGDLSEVRGQRSEARRMRAGDPKVFRARYPWLDSRRIILFLSRIDRKKGIELLIDAFAMVRNQQRDVALVIAGDGEESYVRELRDRVRRNLRSGSASGSACPTEEGEREGDYEHEHEHEHDDVIWTGHLSGEMKAAALAAADVFVLPSASENFGIAAAESLAAGVPTIVSEEVALSDDIRRYDAGMVVQRDAQQLDGAIGELLSDRERAAGLAVNGRRLAEERYSPEAVGRALHELYQKIIT
jgi:glycosyltransferase involved in cell wall biosynthesis